MGCRCGARRHRCSEVAEAFRGGGGAPRPRAGVGGPDLHGLGRLRQANPDARSPEGGAGGRAVAGDERPACAECGVLRKLPSTACGDQRADGELERSDGGSMGCQDLEGGARRFQERRRPRPQRALLVARHLSPGCPGRHRHQLRPQASRGCAWGPLRCRSLLCGKYAEVRRVHTAGCAWLAPFHPLPCRPWSYQLLRHSRCCEQEQGVGGLLQEGRKL
mmetsp:Transcript_10131/g.22819  ORF Transcript_10131/g.22819 Transcript_10131/m.22819 type:complete len:219 (+) Transcript_10131:1991-2647(+)